MRRLVLAVLAGFVFWSVVWVAAGLIVRSLTPDSYDAATGAVVSTGVLLLFVAVSVVISLVAGWIAAALAGDAARRAALILAGLLLLVGLAVEISAWATAPAWYHLVFLALLLPATLAGARLRAPLGR